MSAATPLRAQLHARALALAARSAYAASPAAARLAAAAARLAAAQAEHDALQVIVHAENLPAWSRARVAAAAARRRLCLDGDGSLRGVADVIAAQMAAPPTTRRFEEYNLYSGYAPLWDAVAIDYLWAGGAVSVTESFNFNHDIKVRATPADDVFLGAFFEWTNATHDDSDDDMRIQFELRDVPERFWPALVERELRELS